MDMRISMVEGTLGYGVYSFSYTTHGLVLMRGVSVVTFIFYGVFYEQGSF
jgi:hypothetical protein